MDFINCIIIYTSYCNFSNIGSTLVDIVKTIVKVENDTNVRWFHRYSVDTIYICYSNQNIAKRELYRKLDNIIIRLGYYYLSTRWFSVKREYTKPNRKSIFLYIKGTIDLTKEQWLQTIPFVLDVYQTSDSSKIVAEFNTIEDADNVRENVHHKSCWVKDKKGKEANIFLYANFINLSDLNFKNVYNYRYVKENRKQMENIVEYLYK